MGNIFFKIFFKPVNLKQPNKFFDTLIIFLKLIGMWPPDSNKKSLHKLYSIYSILFRVIFMYIFGFCQAMLFKEVSNFKESSIIIFTLITQFSLAYKLEYCFINRYRIKACVKQFNNKENVPQNDEEDEIIRKSLLCQMNFVILYTYPLIFGFVPWAFLPFQSGFQLPIPAWYPFEVKKYPNYYFAFVYNYFGVLMGATANISTDFTVTALFLSTKAQIERLGVAIENVQSTTQLKKCILRHKQLLEFSSELQRIFSKPMFLQFVCTTFVVCTTLFAISEAESFAAVAPVLGYLNSMILQIFLHCWAGNEVSLALDSLTQKIFSSSFENFEEKSSNLIMIFMQRTLYFSKIRVGSIFKISLSIKTFMEIIKSSYSFFTLLRSMHQ